VFSDRLPTRINLEPFLAQKKKQMYRYDGLYKVDFIEYQETENSKTVKVRDPAKHLQQKKLPIDRIYIFYLQRVQSQALHQQDTNTIPNNEILFQCVHKLTMDPNVLKRPVHI
jgi:hypothetical protein